MAQSDMFKLDWKDVARGAVSAVVAAVALAVYGVFSTPDFNLFAVDWNHVFQLAINAAASGFVGYLGKRFLTDQDGKVFGKI